MWRLSRAGRVGVVVLVWIVGVVGVAGVAAPAGGVPEAAVVGGVPGSVMVGGVHGSVMVGGVHGSIAERGVSPRTVKASASAAPRVSPRWSWPVKPLRLVRAYEAPASPYAAGHRGIDLAAPPGAIVTAPSDATVHFVGVVVDRPVLTLDHGSGVLSSYEPVVADGLAVGDPVTRGMVLGVVGEGAHCSGACLHVGVRVDGDYVSPLLFFERPPRAVLLPLRPAEASRAGTHDRPVRRGGGRGGRSL